MKWPNQGVGWSFPAFPEHPARKQEEAQAAQARKPEEEADIAKAESAEEKAEAASEAARVPPARPGSSNVPAPSKCCHSRAARSLAGAPRSDGPARGASPCAALTAASLRN
jgi:hypothetical protein